MPLGLVILARSLDCFCRYQVRLAAVFGLTGMSGTYLGARLGVWMPDTLQMVMFAGIMLLAAWRMCASQPLRQVVMKPVLSEVIMMNAKQELLSSNPVISMLTNRQLKHYMSEHIGALEGFAEAFGKMTSLKVDAGDDIVRYRDRGDRYYIIMEGRAEVWKPDLETDEWSCVALLGPGDAFGEEAILVGGFRNATVQMITSGVLLVLEEDVFNIALRSRLVEEVTPEQAQVMASREDTKWLDCRFDIEYSEVRITNARLLPLFALRQSTHKLDHRERYLVYCRCGQRSVCATYLLRERGFNAFSVKGGIRDWPYALEHGT